MNARQLVLLAGCLGTIGLMIGCAGTADADEASSDPAREPVQTSPEPTPQSTTEPPSASASEETQPPAAERIGDDKGGVEETDAEQPPEAEVVGEPAAAPAPPEPRTVVDGVTVTDLATGSEGPAVGAGSMVRLRLEGRLVDGTVFQPDAGPVGPWPVSALIDGLAIGLRRMTPGGRRLIEVSPVLAYGDEPVLGEDGGVLIPAGSTVIYEVEVLEVDGQGAVSDTEERP